MRTEAVKSEKGRLVKQTGSSPVHDPQDCQINTILDSSTSGQVFLYDQYNNLTDKYEYDYGSAPDFGASCPGTEHTMEVSAVSKTAASQDIPFAKDSSTMVSSRYSRTRGAISG
jgi:hypothetical protein